MVTMGTWFVNNLLEQKANGTIDFNWESVVCQISMEVEMLTV